MPDDMAPPMVTDAANGDPLALAREALAALATQERERHALVLALVAPVGTQLESVDAALAESFGRYGYALEPVRLADLLDELPYKPLGDLPKRGTREYYEARMDAGDRLREDVGHGAALAAAAIGKTSAA